MLTTNECIRTARLTLRRYQAKDLEDFFAYVSDPEVVRFEPYRPMTRAEARSTLTGRIASDEFIAVELSQTRRLIGNLYLGRRDFNAFELGYVFHKAYWHLGYAREACAAMVARAFAAGAHRIYAECDPENIASCRLLERLGFAREAWFTDNVFFWRDERGRPIWKDTLVYARRSPDAMDHASPTNI